MLYRPEAFEPLTETVWDKERVRTAIRALVDDVDGVCRRFAVRALAQVERLRTANGRGRYFLYSA